jgi:hypothetical protein
VCLCVCAFPGRKRRKFKKKKNSEIEKVPFVCVCVCVLFFWWFSFSFVSWVNRRRKVGERNRKQFNKKKQNKTNKKIWFLKNGNDDLLCWSIVWEISSILFYSIRVSPLIFSRLHPEFHSERRRRRYVGPNVLYFFWCSSL